jgi:hypothetical protein
MADASDTVPLFRPRPHLRICLPMTLTLTELERIAAWCDTSAELAFVRRRAEETFFEPDEGPVDYAPELGDVASRRRRFLGWFLFDFVLPDGSRPAELAARRLFDGEQRAAAVEAVGRARYVQVVVASVMPGRGALLELEEERFEVRSRAWARLMRRDALVLAHLVPVRPGVWLPGPGWLEWPVAVGPNMRRELRQYQPDPIEVERVLQGRHRRDTDDLQRPRDETLAEAVHRMTEAAKEAGRPGLVRSEEEWRTLVLRHLLTSDITAFAREVIALVGDVEDVRELNQWMALAQNIWNTTPQPDRGGLSAYELATRTSRREPQIDSWRD